MGKRTRNRKSRSNRKSNLRSRYNRKANRKSNLRSRYNRKANRKSNRGNKRTSRLRRTSNKKRTKQNRQTGGSGNIGFRQGVEIATKAVQDTAVCSLVDQHKGNCYFCHRCTHWKSKPRGRSDGVPRDSTYGKGHNIGSTLGFLCDNKPSGESGGEGDRVLSGSAAAAVINTGNYDVWHQDSRVNPGAYRTGGKLDLIKLSEYVNSLSQDIRLKGLVLEQIDKVKADEKEERRRKARRDASVAQKAQGKTWFETIFN